MMRLLNWTLCALVLASYSPVCLGGTTFTNRAAFEAALTGLTIEEFEDEPLVGNASTGAVAALAFDDFSVTSVPAAGKVLNVSSFGAINTTPAGANYLYLDTDIGFSGMAVTFTFANALTGFGFDYSANFEPGNVLSVTVDGTLFNLAGSQPGQPQFWGYIDDPGQSFAAASVLNQSIQSGLGVDRVSYATIPEPASLLLVTLGMIRVVAGLRRRRTCE